MARWLGGPTLIIILAGVGPVRAQLPDTVVRELAGLDGAVTLGEWLRAHPGDSLARYAFDPFLQDSRWCAQAVAPARQAERRTLTRRTVFERVAPPAVPRLARQGVERPPSSRSAGVGGPGAPDLAQCDRPLGAAERAAALLAADRVVRLTAPSFDRTGPADSGRSTPFTRATGARYVYAELGGADAYAGNLLKEARQVAPASPAGRLALLLLLEGGFMDPVCGGATEGEDFRTVIAEGERFLGSDSTPEWRTRAHLGVADAYRDIVALDAGTLEYSIGDPARHHAEAPRARRRAIEHYRAALDFPDDRSALGEPRLERSLAAAGDARAGGDSVCVRV